MPTGQTGNVVRAACRMLVSGQCFHSLFIFPSFPLPHPRSSTALKDKARPSELFLSLNNREANAEEGGGSKQNRQAGAPCFLWPPSPDCSICNVGNQGTVFQRQLLPFLHSPNHHHHPPPPQACSRSVKGSAHLPGLRFLLPDPLTLWFMQPPPHPPHPPPPCPTLSSNTYSCSGFQLLEFEPRVCKTRYLPAPLFPSP